jgi:hypothetical protein
VAKKSWRCFFCDEMFTREQDAREHFGPVAYSVAACQIKGYEGGLVEFIRQQERELAKYRAEIDPLTRTIEALQAEGVTAIRRAEEEGYARGVADVLALSCADCVAKVRGEPVTALAIRRDSSTENSNG